MKIKSITLNRFRGATRPLTISFDVRKKFTLIYGENGTGKSSVVDALEYLWKKKKESAFLSVGATGNNPEVKITDQTGTEYTVESPFPNKIAILRRSFMSELCLRQPAGLYEFFQEFLDVSNLQKSENNLGTAIKDLNEQTTNLSSERTNLILDIETIYRTHISAELAHPIIDAKEYVKQSMEDKIATRDELKATGDLYRSLIEHLSQLEKQITLTQNKKSAIQGISQKLDLRLMSLLNLLSEASEIIQQDNTSPTKCPVCEQPIIKESVLVSINKRLQEIAETKALVIQKKQLENELQQAEAGVEMLNKQIAKQLKNPLSTPHIPTYALNLVPDAAMEELKKKLEEWSPKLPLVDKEYNALAAQLAIYGQLKEKVERLNTVEAKFNDLNILYHKGEFLLGIFKTTRKIHVQNLLEQLNQDICMFYDQMHSGEGIANLKLEVKENRNKSVELLAEFHGKQDVQPKSYYSEAHLDSLGLAMFLAVAKAQQKEILVLDDILTSLDLKHIHNILELLKQLLQNGTFKQIILTTHYERLWSDCKFRGNGYYDVIKLNPWNFNTGILPLNNFSTLFEDLKVAISKPQIDKAELSMKAGLQLDAVLNFICEAYNIPLPYAKPRYTLGDYFAAVNKLKKRLKVLIPNDKEIPLEELFDNCDRYDWIRNEYAHINLDAEVSEDEVKQFALDVQKLSNALFCEKCKCYIIKRDKQTGIRSCVGHCKKLEPVEL